MTYDEASQWLETLAAKFLSVNHRELLNEEVVSLLEARQREFEQVFLTDAVRGFSPSHCVAVLEVLSERHSQIQERKNRAEDLGSGRPGDGLVLKVRETGSALDSRERGEVSNLEDRQSQESSPAKERVEDKSKKLGRKFSRNKSK